MGEITVLDLDLRQIRGVAAGGVDGEKLPRQDLLRPGVGDQVVEGDDQEVVLRREVEEKETDEGPPDEIEGTTGFLGGDPPDLRFLLTGLEARKVPTDEAARTLRRLAIRRSGATTPRG